MNLKYFDIHCHLNDKKFEPDRNGVIRRMKAESVGAFVVGTDRKMSEDAISLAEAHDNIWAVVGMHPHDNETEVFEKEFYLNLAKHPKVVAIGECGLDFGRDGKIADEDRLKQEKIFREHVEIAIEVGKPLMIHCRNAYERLIEILDEYLSAGKEVRGNMHFFAGNWETAQKFLSRGFTLSFDGPITWAREYDEVIRNCPAEMLMAETDAPYVAPAFHRGQRNEPIFVKEIIAKMAEIRGIGADEMAKITTENAVRFFKL